MEIGTGAGAYEMQSYSVASRQPSVQLINAYKRYGSGRPILSGLNMSVPSGSIYGLLGPSGCGKTTLLRCIMGRINLDQGTIKLEVRKRKEIGYMLQEIALQLDLSINETFDYFGRLFEMPSSEIKSRKQEVAELLELPHGDRTVSSLSGGQQRRLSFAVCLLHNPKLLILDEPTVGLDPLLRESLWEHLLQLSKAGRTIVITTHYIEEAKQANVVGLMRGGLLLAEKGPEEITAELGCSSLEAAFLQLCCRQDRMAADPVQQENQEKMEKFKKKKKSSHLDPEPIFNVNKFWAQFNKHLLWMRRNPSMFWYLMLLPTVCTYLSHSLYLYTPHDLNLGIVSDEAGSPAACLQQHLIGAQLSCNGTSDLKLSCWYHDHIQKAGILNFEWLGSVEEGRRLVERGRLWGYLRFPKNFTEAFGQRIDLGRFIADRVLDSTFIDVWLDQSNSVKVDYLKMAIVNSIKDLTQEMVRVCDAPEKVGHVPVRFEDAIFLTNEPNYAYSGQPSMFLPFVFYLSLMFTISMVMMEKNGMLLERSLSAGMTFTETVMAHLVNQFIFVGLQIVIMLISCYGIYGNPIEGSFLLVVFIIFLVEGLGVAYGYLLGFLFEAERIASFAAVGSIVILLDISTLLWPIEGMHWLLRHTMFLFPVVPAILSYQSVALRGWSILHPGVYFGILQTLVWVVIISGLAFLCYRLSGVKRQR